MSGSKRVSAIVVIATLTLAFTQIAAFAGGPDREPLTLDPVVIDGVCNFPVLAEALINQEMLTTFYDQEGNVTKQLITGRLVSRLTNLESGRSVVVNTSGPGRITFEGDTFVLRAHGPGLMFFFPNELGIGDPGLLKIVKGSYTLTITPDGTERLSNVRGSVTDVCELLS